MVNHKFINNFVIVFLRSPNWPLSPPRQQPKPITLLILMVASQDPKSQLKTQLSSVQSDLYLLISLPRQVWQKAQRLFTQLGISSVSATNNLKLILKKRFNYRTDKSKRDLMKRQIMIYKRKSRKSCVNLTWILPVISLCNQRDPKNRWDRNQPPDTDKKVKLVFQENPRCICKPQKWWEPQRSLINSVKL